MRTDDIQICREVQRNAEMAIKAMDTIADKVHDKELSRDISKQVIKYSEIKNKALDKLYEAKAEPHHTNRLEDIMLAGGIHSKTLLNTSTSHIAGLMIQGNTRGVTEMQKAINHYNNAGDKSLELAKELMDFEEDTIKRLKQYL